MSAPMNINASIQGFPYWELLPPLAKNFLIYPPGKIPPQEIPPLHQILIFILLPHQKNISPLE